MSESKLLLTEYLKRNVGEYTAAYWDKLSLTPQLAAHTYCEDTAGYIMSLTEACVNPDLSLDEVVIYLVQALECPLRKRWR